MSEIKTQEEFEAKINDMVDKINNAPTTLISDELLELWDDCNRMARFFVDDDGYGPFYTDILVRSRNNEFSEMTVKIKSEYYLFLELRDNFVYDPMSFLETLSYVCDEYIYHLRNSFEAAEREREREKA
ncbi:MAG: hypothetical protein ACI4OW_06540 [Alphaproteobacteria bacterium]